MKITALQLDSVWEDPRANFARVRAMLVDAPLEPGGLLVLPEMFATGFSLDLTRTLGAAARETEAFLRALAEERQCAVLAGIVSESADGRARNEAVVFAPDGSELARYEKQRPFTGAGEDTVHLPGSRAVVFEWGGVKIAPLVCYDLRFPELFRAALRLGAELFVVIAAWPVKRIEHWTTLLRARAIENQAYVLGVNRTGGEPDFEYSGQSLLVDPHGIVCAQAGTAQERMHATVEAALVRTWREEFPAVRDFLSL